MSAMPSHPCQSVHSEKEERIAYGQVIGPDPWPLQVMQDTFAFGADIPLRLLRREAIINLWATLESLPGDGALRHLFKNREAFSHRIAEMVVTRSAHDGACPPLSQDLPGLENGNHGLKFLEEKIWVTRPSNEFLMLREFRQRNQWRLWEILWLHHHLLGCSEPTEFQQVFGIPHLVMACHPFPAGFEKFEDMVLIVGPILLPGELRVGAKYDEYRVEKAIDRYKKMVGTVDSDRKDRMTTGGHFRLPLTLSSLRAPVARVKHAVPVLTGLTLPKGHRRLRQCDHASLAELALFLACHKTFPGVDGEIYFRVDHFIGKENPNERCSSQCGNHGEVLGERKDSNWIRVERGTMKVQCGLQLSLDERQFQLSPSATIAVPRLEGQDHDEVLEELENDFLHFAAGIYGRKQAFETEHLGLMREWLNSYFGTLVDIDPSMSQERWYRNICTQINEFIGSDAVGIYRYDHASRCLEANFIYFADPALAPKWTAERKMMLEAGNNKKLRAQSICYRIVDRSDKPMRFTRWFDPETNTSNPEDEPLLPAAPGIKSAQSAIATPISIFGRIWGVLEVKGMRPYQFRWSDGILVQQVSKTLAQFLYHQEVLSQLHQINSHVTKERSTEQEIMSAASTHLARIFMSHGASLWLRDSYDPKRFLCKGEFNRAEIGKQILKEPNSVFFRTDDSDSLSAPVLNMKSKPLLFLQKRYGCNKLRDAWQKSLNLSPDARIPLPNQDIDHLTVIRIHSPNEANPIATLSLYNIHPSDECYTPAWTGLLTFVAGHVALLFEAFSNRQSRERDHRRYIEHEIRQRVLIVANRGQTLANLVDRHRDQKYPILANNPRFRQVLKDLIIYTKYVMQTVEMLAEKQFTAAMRAGKNPIIAHAEQLIRQEYPLEVNIREMFATSISQFFTGHGRTVSYGGITIPEPPRPSFDQDLDAKRYLIRIHPWSLQTILDNLLWNALKYANKDYDIVAEYKKLDSGAQFTLRNVAPPLKPGEKYRLTQMGFRGETAETLFPKKGDGNGLFFVQRICELYGIDFRYDVEDLGPQLSFHIPTLVFPENKLCQTGQIS